MPIKVSRRSCLEQNALKDSSVFPKNKLNVNYLIYLINVVSSHKCRGLYLVCVYEEQNITYISGKSHVSTISVIKAKISVF